jgi:hypothetical protein
MKTYEQQKQEQNFAQNHKTGDRVTIAGIGFAIVNSIYFAETGAGGPGLRYELRFPQSGKRGGGWSDYDCLTGWVDTRRN